MSRVNAGWIVGMGTLVIPSCATHVTFRDHHHAAGAAGAAGTTGSGAGGDGRGGAGGHSTGGTSGKVGGGDAGGSAATDGGSMQSGGSNTGGAPQTNAGKAGAGGGSGRNSSTGGVENANGGSPDDAGSGNAGESGCGPGDSCGCPGTTHACGNGCVDYSTSKDNCGSCGNACEGYQFCDGGKCLPHYVSTRVQPVTSGGDLGGVGYAAVFTDGTEDDLLLGVGGDLVLSAPGAAFTAEIHGSGLARYTPDGTLVWSRDFNALLGVADAMPVLLGNGDIGLGYLKYDPPTGPVAGTYTTRVSRVGGHTGNLVWEAKYPDKLSSFSGTISGLVSLPAKQEIVSFTNALSFTLGGPVYQTTDLGSSGVVSTLASQSYIMDAVAGGDGSTLWIWGAYDDTIAAKLNPWTSQSWQLTGNPSQFSGGDGYLLGARDDGTTTGPWFTEGDYGVLMKLLIDAAGDLIVAFGAGGIVTFNGGQELLPTAGCVLTKIDHGTGHIVWKTTISASSNRSCLPDELALAPGNRVVAVANTGDSPYTLAIYSATDGSFLSSFSDAGVVNDGLVASGETQMYLTGSITGPADFDPGATTDTLGATPGVFVSRFSFE